MMNKAYLGFGTILLTALAYAQFRGVSFSDVDEVKDVPKSVRDNPGAYRAHYAAYSRYSGGK